MPVSVPAVAVYFLLTLLLVTSHARMTIDVATLMAGTRFGIGFLLGGAAVWFTWVQWRVIRRFCAYCTVLQGIGLCICVLSVVQQRIEPLPNGTLNVALTAASIGLVGLVAGQVLVAPKLYAIVQAPVLQNVWPAIPPTSVTENQREISVLGGAVNLELSIWPRLGSLDARHVVVCLFDYTCPVCRQTHGFLSEAGKKYPGELAFVLLPVPMDPTCNRHLSKQHHLHAHACKFARLALLVWQSNPAVYEAFDRWVFQEAEPPPIGMAIQKAKELLKTDDVDPARPDGDVDPLIFQAIDWYKKLDTQRIPTLLFAKASLKGQLPSVAELCRILEQEYPDLKARVA